MVVHRFVVEPKSCATFVDAFEHDVVSAASTVGLNLELFARDRTADRVLRVLDDRRRVGVHVVAQWAGSK